MNHLVVELGKRALGVGTSHCVSYIYGGSPLEKTSLPKTDEFSEKFRKGGGVPVLSVNFFH